MRRYDLNLLHALDALLVERSVSGAARRLGIGQPAMSAALGRLRATFGDPLLVRHGGSMQPTPRALALAQPLRAALTELAALVEPPAAFDAATAVGQLRVSGGDYVGMTILPDLVAVLASAAPRLDLRFRYLEKDRALECLDGDQLDLALMVRDDPGPRFEDEPLIEERLTCVARFGHPILAGVVDLETFAAHDQLLITERADAVGRVDEVLAANGLSRRIAVTLPSAALVAGVLRATDLIAAIPTRTAHLIAAAGGVTTFEPPVDLGSWTMRMVWIRRRTNDAALIWLRDLLTGVARGLGSRTSDPL